jgi:hypothetical protein
MGFVGSGLVCIIVGMLLVRGTDSPSTMETSEKVGLVLLVAGVVLVLVGIVVQVVSVNRADRRGAS